MKNYLLLAVMLWSITASAQFAPNQVLTAAVLNNQFALKTTNSAAAITGGTITGLSAPIPLASGGTGANTATGATTQLQYLQGATGTIARSLTNKFLDTVSVLDFAGSDSLGLTDSTAGINAACANGKSFYFPAGIYLYSGGCTLSDGQVVIGAGRKESIIKATAPAATLFNAAGYGSGLRSIGFSANVTQTGGTYVSLTGPESFIDDYFMDGDFNGITMTGNVSRIRHGRMQNGASGATRIFAGGGDNSQVIDDVLMGAQSPQISRAGIEVKNSYALTIGHVSVLQQGTNLLIDPATSSDNVGSLYVHDSFFDFGSSANIKINATGTGSVVRSRFANVWAGDGAADGVSIVNGGTGMINGVHFIDPHLMLNAGAGLTTGGSVGDIAVLGGEVAQNAYGMYFNSGLNGLVVVGSAIGNVGGMNGNTNSAIVIAGAGSNQINIQGNNLCGNGSAISDNSGAVSSKVIRGNNCYNPIASTSITVGASPFTFTNTLGDTVNVFVNGGTVSSVTLGGNAVASATNTVVPVTQGASVVVTYSAAPTMKYIGY